MLISEAVERFGGELEGDGSLEMRGVTGIEFAGPDEATFALNEKTLAAAEASPACCVIAPRGLRRSAKKTLIRCDSPNSYAADLLEFFHPAPAVEPGVHPTAVVDDGAEVDRTASIGPHASVGRRCRVGRRARLMACVCLADGCEIGDDTTIYPNVTIYSGVRIGARVIIHAGAVIGADGFGYFPDADGLRKWPHVGNVVIEDEVEIGANACVDRSKFGTTLVQRGAKIDNLVQIGHNCRIGAGSVLAALAGLSGGVVFEEGVACGGQVGVADHVTIGRRAMLAAQTGVISDVPAGAVQFGCPSRPHRKAMQEVAMLGFLTENRKALRKLVRGATE
jgi:UDP-3-O-[3-hydroxymyristoyl] glucosamine N-acyltransferase